jgi:hypothetical protein
MISLLPSQFPVIAYTVAAFRCTTLSLAAGPPARPPGTVESLDRRAPREPEYPLGPELEDRVTAPDQLILYRGRLWVDNEG